VESEDDSDTPASKKPSGSEYQNMSLQQPATQPGDKKSGASTVKVSGASPVKVFGASTAKVPHASPVKVSESDASPVKVSDASLDKKLAAQDKMPETHDHVVCRVASGAQITVLRTCSLERVLSLLTNHMPAGEDDIIMLSVTGKKPWTAITTDTQFRQVIEDLDVSYISALQMETNGSLTVRTMSLTRLSSNLR
jgi:hypothetical protein